MTQPKTCATCKFQVAADRNCQLIGLFHDTEIRLAREAHVDPFDRRPVVPRPGDPRFLCSFHAARPGQET